MSTQREGQQWVSGAVIPPPLASPPPSPPPSSGATPNDRDLQLDLASAILRIEQAHAERGTALGDLLLERLQSDARRLRTHLTPEWRSRLEEAEQLGSDRG